MLLPCLTFGVVGLGGKLDAHSEYFFGCPVLIDYDFVGKIHGKGKD